MPRKTTIPTLKEWLKAGYGRGEDDKPLEGEDLDKAFARFVERLKEEQADADLDEGKPVRGLSYPPHPRKDPVTRALRGKWRDQKRVKCMHGKCAYPLNVIMEKGQRIKIEVPEGHEFEGDVAYKAECSWDPRHLHPDDDSVQYVTHAQLYPPDDAGDEDL